MALNAAKIESKTKDFFHQEPLEAGNYLARVVQVIDLGSQPQRPYQGQEKDPAQEIMVTYELVTEFCKDEDGNVLEDKPRWISETFPLLSIESDLAKSTKRIKMFDRTGEINGDFSKIVGEPCTVTVVTNAGKGRHEGKVFMNVGQVTPPMKGIPVPELINKGVFFDLDEPDLEVFNSLSEWLRDKITSNLNYQESKLQALLNGDSYEEPKEQEEAPEEDAPY